MEAGEVKFGLALGMSAAAFIVSLLNAITGDGIFSGIGDWLSKIIRRRRGWDECPRLHAARKFLGAKLLAGGYGKHHAYYIAGDGRVLVADAVDFYLALFAGVEDFWHVVACAERHQRGTHLLAAPLKEIDFGDGERGYTRVHYCGGETYIDIGPVGDLSYPHRCTWATADEFKQAVVDAQAKASECGKGNDGVSGDFHGREV